MGSKTNSKSKAEMEAEEDYNRTLEWIRFRQDALGEHAFPEEESSGKLVRKIKENPFVPIGAFATTLALGYGLWMFRKGRGRDSQKMMRARIAAQGFTIVAIIGGFFLGSAAKPPTTATATAAPAPAPAPAPK